MHVALPFVTSSKNWGNLSTNCLASNRVLGLLTLNLPKASTDALSPNGEELTWELPTSYVRTAYFGYSTIWTGPNDGSVDAEVGHVQLKWEGTSASATIFAFGTGTSDTNVNGNFPAITNNATGPTGNVTIKTVGTTANAAYTVIIELHKNGAFYDRGQLTDPAAFNYGAYSLKP